MSSIKSVLLLFICGCSVLTITNAYSIWNDPCYMRASSPSNPDDVKPLPLNKNCNNGTIDWDYPSDSIQLLMDKGEDSTFTFCVVESWVTYHGGLKDLTGGRNVDLPLPTKGNPSCVSSTKGKTLVAIVASEIKYYMTSIRFTVT